MEQKLQEVEQQLVQTLEAFYKTECTRNEHLRLAKVAEGPLDGFSESLKGLYQAHKEMSEKVATQPVAVASND